jgi:hypothetical protein
MPRRSWSGSSAMMVRLRARAAPTFAGHHEILRIRRECLPDHLVDDSRAALLRGVDVIDAEFDVFPQHSDRSRSVRGRAEHVSSGQPHGPISDGLDRIRSRRRLVAGAGAISLICLRRRFVAAP